MYSTNTPENNQQSIREKLIAGLRQYEIVAKSHDLAVINESLSLWLEREIANATTVLCVCNKEFKEDWESVNGNTASSGYVRLGLVQSLRHLVYATVNQGGNLSKYAMVFLEESDEEYVPTKYLQGDPRHFMMDNVEDIVKFVSHIPTHVTSA